MRNLLSAYSYFHLRLMGRLGGEDSTAVRLREKEIVCDEKGFLENNFCGLIN